MLSKYSQIFILLAISSSVLADSDLENSNLAKLASELDFLMNRVDMIKGESKTKGKTKFHYLILKQDLNLIKMGINSHLQKSLRTSKIIEPLKAHYHAVNK